MNRPLLFALAWATLLGVACSSTTDSTDPEAPEGSSPIVGSPGSSGSSGTPDASGALPDAGQDAERPADAGTDAAPPVDPVDPAFSKAEVQALFGMRCAGCHIGGSAAGLSLAGDFTTTTVGVASTQVPAMMRIAAGSKATSYLFHKLAGTHLTVGGSGVRMPSGGPPFLSEVELERIGKYIDGL